MRALFVNPVVTRDLELFHLGTAAITSVVAASGRHQAEYVDFSFRWDAWREHLRERITEVRPHLVGISTSSPRVPHALQVARAVRELSPDTTVVMGGHHASLDTAATAARDCVDFVVVGEGEHSILALLDCLEDGGDLHQVPSLAWQEGDRLVETPLGPLPTAAELDAFPFHDWRLWQQREQAIWHGGFLPMIGVRGCPYRCAFCSSPAMADRMKGCGPFVRKGSPERTAQHCAVQYQRHRRHGLRHMMFYDQNFLMDTAWLEAFAREYRALGLHERLPFSAYTRVDHVTWERLELARSAGCYQLRLGIEAGDAAVRNELLGKRLADHTLHERLALVRRSGIHSLGYFLVGLPGERPAQARGSFALARALGLDRAVFLYFTPLAAMSLDDLGQRTDFLGQERATSFTDDGLGTELSPLDRVRLRGLFYRANGHFLAKGVLRNIRRQPRRFLGGLPAYYRQARRDGFRARQVLTQYVYHHGEAWRYC